MDVSVPVFTFFQNYKKCPFCAGANFSILISFGSYFMQRRTKNPYPFSLCKFMDYGWVIRMKRYLQFNYVCLKSVHVVLAFLLTKHLILVKQKNILNIWDRKKRSPWKFFSWQTARQIELRVLSTTKISLKIEN